METENSENTPLSPKQGHRRRILLSACILLLIGAMIFWGVYQFMQRTASAANVFSPASTVSDLPTDIHWQQVLQNNSFPALTVAPSDPAILYICNNLNPSLEMKLNLTRSRDAGAHWQVLTLPFSGNDILSSLRLLCSLVTVHHHLYLRLLLYHPTNFIEALMEERPGKS